MNGRIIVILDPHERALAMLVGIMRNAAGEARGLAHDPPLPNNVDPFENHMRGALAELAAAKFLGRYWNAGIGHVGLADIPPSVEVKCSRLRRLCVSEKHARAAGRQFVAVLEVGGGSYEILGWFPSGEFRAEWLVRNARGSYYSVPEAMLIRQFDRLRFTAPEAVWEGEDESASSF